MTQNMPNDAFIMAAGKGTRLRPITDTIPKPMVAVNDKPILEHTLEKLRNEGVENVTINLFYLGDRIKNHFKDTSTPKITFSEETVLLETGGGAKKALNTMKNNPFFMINGDALWEDIDGQDTALKQLSTHWDASKMDILLLLQPTDKMQITQGVGDYNIAPNGQIKRTADLSGTHMFTGIRIVHPCVFNDTPDGAFSFLECMDKAEKEGRLYGVEYDGIWHHISTVEDLKAVNNAYQKHTPFKKEP